MYFIIEEMFPFWKSTLHINILHRIRDASPKMYLFNLIKGDRLTEAKIAAPVGTRALYVNRRPSKARSTSIRWADILQKPLCLLPVNQNSEETGSAKRTI